MLYNYRNCHPEAKVITDYGRQLFTVQSIDTELKVINSHSKDLQSYAELEIDPDSPDEYKIYSIPYNDIIITYENHMPKLFFVSL